MSRDGLPAATAGPGAHVVLPRVRSWGTPSSVRAELGGLSLALQPRPQRGSNSGGGGRRPALRAREHSGEAILRPQALREALFFSPEKLGHVSGDVGLDNFRNKLFLEALLLRRAKLHPFDRKIGAGILRGVNSRETLILCSGSSDQFGRDGDIDSFGNEIFGEAVADGRGEKPADSSVRAPRISKWCAEYPMRDGGPTFYREMWKSAFRVWPSLRDSVSEELERESGIRTNARELKEDRVAQAKAKNKKKATKDHDDE